MYYDRILKDTEKRYENLKRHQAIDGVYKGALVSQYKYAEPRQTAYFIKTMMSVYTQEQSKYYKDDEINKRIELGLESLEENQRENGLFDLLDCNFLSAPDTGFLLRELIVAYKLSKLYKTGFDDRMKNIIVKALNGMLEGGFHTPNHRWVISSILLMGYNLFDNNDYKIGAEKYLLEGIDCSVDGEYAERSAAIYNVVSNEAMITIAKELGDDSYLEYARRNLKMMMNFIDVDGSIFANNSTRQDRGTRVLPTEYFKQYLLLGRLENNKEFLAFANYIWNLTIDHAQMSPDILADLILNDDLKFENNECFETLPDYHNYFEKSGIVRGKKDGFSYAIIKDSSSFLYFQVGSLVLSVKVAGCICQHKVFKGETLEKTADGYVLKYDMKGWYYLPFTEKPETTDWWEMPNSERDLVLGPDAYFTVMISEKEDGVDLTVRVDGVDKMPMRVEFAFDESDSVETENIIMPAAKGNYVTVKQGDVLVSKAEDSIKLSKAFYAHNFIAGKFGSEARDPNLFYVYFTDSTPCEQVVCIRKA